MKKNRFYPFLILITLLTSCKSEDIFSLSPSERSARSISELRRELAQAPHGWKVTYFSKTDSTLFADLTTRIERGYEYDYGVGGHFFYMKFDDQGQVNMASDYDDLSATELRQSEYEIKQNSFTQLSFTTFNYLHELVNDIFAAAPDFLYCGKDLDGHLIFKTPGNIEPAREYVRFERATSPEEAQSCVKTALDNRLFFEKMRYPQLKIHKGDREYFNTKYVINQDDSFEEWVSKSIKRRYRVFLNDRSRVIISQDLRGLGSGYTGTDVGLTFHTGIRYDKNNIFYDFQRVGDRFVCELVRVYDPHTRTWRYKSKHLAPNGEPTGMIAEIWDEKVTI